MRIGRVIMWLLSGSTASQLTRPYMKLLHNDNSGDQLFLHCSNLEQRDFMIDVGSSGMLLTIVRIFLKIKIFHIIHIYLHIRFSLLNNICPTTSIQGAVEWTWIWRGALTLFPSGRYQNRTRTPPTQKLFLFFYFFIVLSNFC